LKAAFRYSSLNGIESIFLTMKETQKHLQLLVEDFGFQKFGIDSNLDMVYVKSQPVNPPRVELDPLDYHRKYSPHFRASPEVRKFIVPIVPEFHKMLFPDWSLPTEVTQLQLPLHVDLGQIPGNAIKQAYICKSKISKIERGDVLLFYRSRDTKLLTSIGIVESAERLKDADKIFSRVRKRTVYDIEGIRQLAKNGCLVILFRLAVHFEGRISARDLEQIGVDGPIQSIREMSHEKFEQLVQRISFKNCILAH
ncbi:MAG TPA: N-acetyltransferase, partial [Candidatus Melainabacteria bacterium]|nr:N-acetyltransferase [Candidatus Melainabacteria bacterium]